MEISGQIDEERSSLIKEFIYNEESQEITLFFRKDWPAEHQTWYPMSNKLFVEFTEAKSLGKFYLHIIKKFLKQKQANMADNQPKRINKASNEKRFIKMRIDVSKLNKSLFFVGEKGVYADVTLMMLPDGEVDNYGNLGMIVQDVPKAIAQKEKSLPAEKKTKGAILGNATEFEWEKSATAENAPGSGSGKLVTEFNSGETDPLDDLPF